jgi:transcriptional regulator with XRE-family HTH domain
MLSRQNTFGDELKAIRNRLGLTQVQLSSRAKISAAYISQLETGKKLPTDRVITKLSIALEIPENRLFIKIGKLKMDLAGTFKTSRSSARAIINSLSDVQLDELLNYLAYLKIKSTI